MRTLQGKEPAVLAAFRAEVLDLRKYAVLNSTAVIKAVKKRNRHLRAAVGPALQPLRATDLLSQQYFFTSSKLAALSTQAEVLSKVCGSSFQRSLSGEVWLPGHRAQAPALSPSWSCKYALCKSACVLLGLQTPCCMIDQVIAPSWQAPQLKCWLHTE